MSEVIVTYRDGHSWRLPTDGTIHTEPDQSMEERAFYCDAAIIEHRNLDADPDGPCEGCIEAHHALEEIRQERMRRYWLGIAIDDPAAPTLEERLAPYGIEWELEQRERAGR